MPRSVAADAPQSRPRSALDEYAGVYEYLYRGVAYPAYESLRGRETFRYLREYERSQWLSRDELQALQWAKLQRLLRHCQDHVPYYRDLWAKSGIHWSDLRDMEDYARLPELRKEDIRQNYAALVAVPYQGRTMRKTTGGSTGQPLAFEYTRESYERRMAVAMRGYGWAGARQGMRTAYLWGGDIVPPGRLQRMKTALHLAAVRRKMLNSFFLTRENIAAYVDSLNRFRPEVVVGYAGPLHHLARHCIDHGIALWKPRTVVTGSEALQEFQREAIQQAFGAPVFNTYGCREFMLMASECAARDGLHVNMDHLVLEIADAPSPSGAGRVLVTDLHNFGMPFLRYANGDMASPMAGDCTCGRHLPRLAKVEGRVIDMIRTRDGRTVPGVFFPHLMKDVPGVDRFQVVQKRHDHIVIKIVPLENFDASATAMLEGEVRKVLGTDTRVEYLLVDDIPLTASGKQRVTISELQP